ncbi:MAG TPA: ABC transporter ATP-binding protein [Acidimicrobiales bacterium]|jgi:branched-chain amino acid transport system ATP-binding protein
MSSTNGTNGTNPNERTTVNDQTASGGGKLVVEDLHVRYGLSQALFGVNLHVEPGHVLAVLGPNGAGKSTLGRSISGLVPVASGHVIFGDRDITGLAPHKVRQAGLTYIPEGRGIFPGLSVIDNLRMATRQLSGRSARQAAIDRAIELFPVLGARQGQRAGSLSGGEQQMLAMARALSVGPQLIIADEMSLGLAPLMVDQVFSSLERARSIGISIILIEQFIHRALAFADHCVILTRGAVGWTGPASQAGSEVLNQYLGDAGAEAGADPLSPATGP